MLPLAGVSLPSHEHLFTSPQAPLQTPPPQRGLTSHHRAYTCNPTASSALLCLDCKCCLFATGSLKQMLLRARLLSDPLSSCPRTVPGRKEVPGKEERGRKVGGGLVTRAYLHRILAGRTGSHRSRAEEKPDVMPEQTHTAFLGPDSRSVKWNKHMTIPRGPSPMFNSSCRSYDSSVCVLSSKRLAWTAGHTPL